mmetsp:Transcript_8501/g.8440  ORF Transcript_8501/g.8440 Transcript_8501/m.8440 type:complete len:283 (+) Transcript_8501:431-1279(+)
MNVNGVEKIYLGGGGDGCMTLTKDLLHEEQMSMFKRSIQCSDTQKAAYVQEKRQLEIYNNKIKFTIHVFRKELAHMKTDIDVEFEASSPQRAWIQLMQNIREKMNLIFLESIIDASDNMPIFRILSFIPYRNYYVVERKDSVVMEAVHTNLFPENHSLNFIKSLHVAHQDIIVSDKFQKKLNIKTTSLNSKPMTNQQEYSASLEIINSKSALEIINSINNLMKIYKKNSEKKTEILEKNVPEIILENVPDIDIISLHRLAFESLNRIVLQSDEKCREVVEGI